MDLSHLEKKPKTGSTWTTVNTYKTNTAGRFNFTETLDTTYWDTRIAIKGDTMSYGNALSTADAQKVNQTILGQYTPTGFDFYAMDVNGNNTITILMLILYLEILLVDLLHGQIVLKTYYSLLKPKEILLMVNQ